MRAFLVLLLLSSSALAEDLSLLWNANPAEDNVTEYRVYEKIGLSFNLLVATAATNVTLTNVPTGPHYYVVRAVNFYGESKDSNVLLVGPPAAPTGLQKQ